MNYLTYPEDKIEYVQIFESNELKNGERVNLEIDSFTIILFNIADKYFAIADVCSHDNQPLEEAEIDNEFEITCPRHGAKFDVRNGAVLALPAYEDIPAYPVRVVDGLIEVGLPV